MSKLTKKQIWMGEFERYVHTLSDAFHGKIEWHVAQHFFNEGKSAREAAALYVANRTNNGSATETLERLNKAIDNKPVQFLVSCKHVAARFERDRVLVTVKPATGHEGFWYVSMDGFGCSKDYNSPRRAITAMLQDHCCTDIVIVDAP